MTNKASTYRFGIIFVLFCVFSVNLLFAQESVGTSQQNPPTFFSCEPEDDWSQLFHRNTGWLGGDGIYTISADISDEKRTIFLFSDTLLGTADPTTGRLTDCRMVNHTMGLLRGNQPQAENMTFYHGRGGDMNRTNLFGQKLWLQDGVLIDGKVYILAYRPAANWKPEQSFLVTVPLREGQLHFAEYTAAEFDYLYETRTHQLSFGAGILAMPESDEVFIYGLRDSLRGGGKQLVVAKVERSEFANREKWHFWTGEHWSENIADCDSDKATLARGISSELSVTPMTIGPHKGKYMLVCTKFGMSPELAFAVADSPTAKFSELHTFYICPEPAEQTAAVKQMYGDQASIYCYNAKAHPALSREGELLVSYNVNILHMRPGEFFKSNEHYYPRFVRLSLKSK